MDEVTQFVSRLAREVLAELNLERAFGRILESARSGTNAHYAALGILDESKTRLARFITRGVDPATAARIGDQPTGRGILGVLIEHPELLRLDDLMTDSRACGFPREHPPMSSFLGVPIFIRGSIYGNLYLAGKSAGAKFTDADEQVARLLAELASIAIDHATIYTQTKRQRDELRRTTSSLRAAAEIAQALGGVSDLDTVLDLVADRGRELVGAETLLIALQDREYLHLAAGAGLLPGGLIGRRIPLEGTVARGVISSKQSRRLEGEEGRLSVQTVASQLGFEVNGGLVVPLSFKGRTYGVLIALNRVENGPFFSNGDEQLLEGCAVSAATAVATAASASRERERQRLAAAEAERTRWARELHDDTLQSLSAVHVNLSAAVHSRGDGESGPERLTAGRDLHDHISSSIAQVAEAIANLRTLITNLRPAALDELGTEAAIESLISRVARQGTSIALKIDLAYEQGRAGTRHISELETAIYRIVQEALTNAVKHGEARNINIEIRESESDVALTVSDDGKGFDPAARTNGFGLLGMRERAALLGGELEVDAEPGRGSVVRARMPAQRRQSAERDIRPEKVA